MSFAPGPIQGPVPLEAQLALAGGLAANAGAVSGAVIAHGIEVGCKKLEKNDHKKAAMVVRGVSGTSGGVLTTTSLLHVSVFAKAAIVSTSFFAAFGGALVIGAAAGVYYSLKREREEQNDRKQD